MEHKALHSSSLGRIYLMLKADLIANRRSLLTLFGGFVLLAYFLPRLTILFDMSWEEFNRGWASGYSLFAIQGFMNLIVAIAFCVYLNKRTIHSQPTLFATLPLSLREKLISIHLYGLLLFVFGYIAVRLELFMELLTIPNLLNGLTFESIWSPIGVVVDPQISAIFDEYRGYPFIPIGMLLSVLGFGALTYAIFLNTSIRIRHAFVGLFVAYLTWGITIFSYIAMISNAKMTLLSPMHYVRYDGDYVTYSVYWLLNALFTWGIVSGLLYWAWRRFKTIPS